MPTIQIEPALTLFLEGRRLASPWNGPEAAAWIDGAAGCQLGCASRVLKFVRAKSNNPSGRDS